jgi:hypothetical protein
MNNYEKTDERLFNTFISEPKSTCLPKNDILNDLSEEEESSDSSNRVSVIGTGRKSTKQCPVSLRKRETKCK